MPGYAQQFLGEETISDLSTAKSLTIPTKEKTFKTSRDFHVPNKTIASRTITKERKVKMVRVYASGANVRWKQEGAGDLPTATAGNVLEAGTSMDYEGDVKKLRFIQESAGAGLYVEYYGY